MHFYHRDFLCTQEWNKDELLKILHVAKDMQRHRFAARYSSLLQQRSFMMLFYDPSVRTRQSFSVAATELGGHAPFLESRTMRLRTEVSAGESIEDLAQVMSRFAVGIGIRWMEEGLANQGDGHRSLQEFAGHANVPIINMADDMYHPCQAMAGLMGLHKHLGPDLRGKRILISWARGALARAWCSVQATLLITSRMGMDVVLAHPEGYELDETVIAQAKQNCLQNGGRFQHLGSPVAGYADADVVYSRHWISREAFDGQRLRREEEIEKALGPAYNEWICTQEKMAQTNRALFMHPMPIDRGREVTDEVASGPTSIVYDVAENRLHVQKAIMALTMNEAFARTVVEGSFA